MNDSIHISEIADTGHELLNVDFFRSPKMQTADFNFVTPRAIFHLVFLETGRFAFFYKEPQPHVREACSNSIKRLLQNAFQVHYHSTSCTFTCFPDFFASLKPDDSGYINEPENIWIKGRRATIKFNELPALEYLFFCLWDYLFRPGKKNAETIAIHTELSRFVQTAISRISKPVSLSENQQERHLITIQRGKDFIFRNFRKDFSIQELATYCYVSPFHFSRIFKHFTGYAPAKYIHVIRLKQAELLLRGTNLSLQHICAHSGFKRQDYFSAVFKRKFQLSPAQYKNNMTHPENNYENRLADKKIAHLKIKYLD